MKKNLISKILTSGKIKKIWLIFIILFGITLVSCTSNHRHNKREWKYSETEHWKVLVCDHKNCVVEQEVNDFGEHIDKDWDHSCDICGYELNDMGDCQEVNRGKKEITFGYCGHVYRVNVEMIS